MRLPDERDNQMTPQMITAMVGVAVMVLLILVLVLAMNRKPERTGTAGNAEDAWQGTQEAAGGPSGSDSAVAVGTLHPSDFDFWNRYPEGTGEDPADAGSAGGSGSPNGTNGSSEAGGNGAAGGNENASSGTGTVPGAEQENDPSTDGRHTLVVNRDGEEEWVLISPYLPKQDYDFTSLVSQSDVMKYYEDGALVSRFGIDISRNNDYIDFVKVKKAGVDFVMIRLGARGYGTGQITIDDYFTENLKRATDAGLQVGIYFTSQAVTEEEALEEAELCVDAAADYRIDYPIVIDMGFASSDTARIEELSRAEKTEILKVFLDAVAEAGYTGMIRGDKEWLIKEIDLSKLTEYDVWLTQIQDLPDYPYRFTMWQYKTDGSVDGISGYVNFNISFLDYSEK